MELVSAICPACKKQIEVNSSEAVDFCKSCGKPLVTKEAIKLYADSIAELIKNEDISHKPSEEVIQKFNAILAQDYRIAKTYLDDIIKKEYPKLDKSCYPSYETLASEFSYSSAFPESHIEAFRNLYRLNPCLAEMCYKLLCVQVNALIKEKNNQTFTGGLAFIKMIFANFEKSLEYILYNYTEPDMERAIKYWQSFEKDLKSCNVLKGKDFDNGYILYLKRRLSDWGTSYITKRKYLTTHIYDQSKTMASLYINEFLRDKRVNSEIKDVYDLGSILVDFLSREGKDTYAVEVNRRSEETRKKLDESKEQSFWELYIERLKNGYLLAALDQLQSVENPTDTHKAELAKFKKGLFGGIKYRGNAYYLDAKDLASKVLSKK